MERRYLETHPWIKFDYKINHDLISMRMGEAFSKCQHLIGTPLKPGVADELASVYLARGALATTAIEGNTLTEDEVAEILKGRKKLPASRQYLEQEIQNVLKVLRDIDRDSGNTGFRLSPEWLKEQNRVILEGLEVQPHVVPGEYTTDTLTVGNVYRSPSPVDIPFLVERLCEWLNRRIDDADKLPDDYKFFNAVITSILAHVYLVWIHPFGDGNGRTARAVECTVLAHTGLVPSVSSNLLSDFYNRTRSRYYERLAAASRESDLDGFVRYALDGFVDLLREQISDVQRMQQTVAWTNYVHEVFSSQPHGEAASRRRS